MREIQLAMAKDCLYRHPRFPVAPFEFDDQVARVFDDMAHRSIPLYPEIIQRQVHLVEHLYQPGTRIYDLGCSNGNLGIGLRAQMGTREFDMVAVDSSEPMLRVYQERLAQFPADRRIRLQCEDIRRTPIENASVVVFNFTLQFIPPAERHELMVRIHAGLNPCGSLLFCEKITHANPVMADLQHTFYYAFKRQNGYSDLEISQKREALEKVLIPETLETHLARLRRVGFKTMDVWLKWFNFAGLMAIK